MWCWISFSSPSPSPPENCASYPSHTPSVEIIMRIASRPAGRNRRPGPGPLLSPGARRPPAAPNGARQAFAKRFTGRSSGRAAAGRRGMKAKSASDTRRPRARPDAWLVTRIWPRDSAPAGGLTRERLSRAQRPPRARPPPPTPPLG